MKERESQTRKDSKGRNLRKGEGEDKNGRYYYNFVNTDGKRKRVYALDIIELREKEKEINADLKDGINTATNDKTTLNDIIKKYLDTKNVKKSSRTTYNSFFRLYVKDSIGQTKIKALTKADLQIYYNKLSQKGLSDSTLKIINSGLIYPALEMAFENELVRKNVAKGANKEHSKPPKEKKALNQEQQERLIDFITKDKTYCIYKNIFIVLLATGLRASELSGLTWNDIDLENRIITINHQLLYKNYGDGGKFHREEPKTSAGKRNVLISEKCYQALLDQKKQQKILNIDSEKEFDGLKNIVFTTIRSTPFSNNELCSIITRSIKKYNQTNSDNKIPEISTHGLRHTFCTRLAENNVDLKTMQYLMGHNDARMTMDIYNHINSERVKKEFAKVTDTL